MGSSAVLNNKSNNQNQNSFIKTPSGTKKSRTYKLREGSVKKREEMEIRKTQPRKRGPKPRPKTAPMSKYRRRTANLRERLRMGEINVAFENLRDKLPNPMAQVGKAKCEKLTKINILHVAINYIRAMENLLETGDSGVASFSEMTKNPLRDEADKKMEITRVLATLMQRADKVPHQPRQKRQKNSNFENESSSSDEDQMDGDLEEDDDENSEEQEFDSFDSDTFKQHRTSSNKFESPTDTQQYIPPLPADTSWTSPSSSSNDSGIGIPACDPLLSTLTPTQINSSSIKFEPVNSSSIKFEQVQTSPASTETTQQHQNLQHNQLQLLQNKVANSLNNNNDDDSLQGMPD